MIPIGLMNRIKRWFSIQRAKQRIDSQIQNFRWETMKKDDSFDYLDAIEENLRIYYEIRGR